MKILIRDLGPGNLEKTVKDEIAQSLFEEVQNGQFILKTPVTVEANVQRVKNTVVVKAKISLRFETSCGRCVEPVEQDFADAVLLTIEVDASQDYIEMDEEVRQELLLNLPQKVLCKEDCKGLCLHCGANLNFEKCKCQK